MAERAQQGLLITGEQAYTVARTFEELKQSVDEGTPFAFLGGSFGNSRNEADSFYRTQAMYTVEEGGYKKLPYGEKAKDNTRLYLRETDDPDTFDIVRIHRTRYLYKGALSAGTSDKDEGMDLEGLQARLVRDAAEPGNVIGIIVGRVAKEESTTRYSR